MTNIHNFCQKCRASLESDALFCDECGSPVPSPTLSSAKGNLARPTASLMYQSAPIRTEWYVYKNGNNIGPISEDQLLSEIKNGRFQRNDLGCKVGDTKWQELGVLFGGGITAEVSPPPPPPAPAPIAYQPAPLVRQQQPARQPEVVYSPSLSNSANNSDVGKVMMYQSNKKSVGVAYLLWIFFGMFGVHRFYIGETGTGAAILIITICSLLLKVVFIGFVTIFISIIWVFIDLFLIPSLVKRQNEEMARRLNIGY